MADQETMLAQNLRDYIGIIRDTIGVEEKQLHLINLVCAFLGMSATDFQVETYSGQQFVLLANLVLEVKANLHWHQSNEELKTRQYIADPFIRPWRTIRHRRLTPTICAFHLGFGLGSTLLTSTPASPRPTTSPL